MEGQPGLLRLQVALGEAGFLDTVKTEPRRDILNLAQVS